MNTPQNIVENHYSLNLGHHAEKMKPKSEKDNFLNLSCFLSLNKSNNLDLNLKNDLFNEIGSPYFSSLSYNNGFSRFVGSIDLISKQSPKFNKKIENHSSCVEKHKNNKEDKKENLDANYLFLDQFESLQIHNNINNINKTKLVENQNDSFLDYMNLDFTQPFANNVVSLRFIIRFGK
jgi:hypothetical protein